MDQIIFFLTEHTVEIQVAWYCVATALLLVTLHKIRQIKKRMQELLGKECDAAEMNLDEEGGTENCIVNMPGTSQVIDSNEKPEMLIDAVLGEVFR